MAGLRPPAEEDIPFVVALVNEHAPERFDSAALQQEWDAPYIELERDARVEADAYALVEPLDDARVWIDVQGRPSRELLDWAEASASERARRAFAGAWSTNSQVLAALEQRSFRLVRHSHRMLIDLAQPTDDPVWPEGIVVRPYRLGDERAFYEANEESFADTWEPVDSTYDEWAHWQLQPPAFVPDLWFLALAGDETAGFAICHPHRSRADLGWVRILGVRRPWRRRGLGRALLLHAFAEFRKRGLAQAGLGVDAESLTGANRLYESVGMQVAARFDIYEKELG